MARYHGSPLRHRRTSSRGEDACPLAIGEQAFGGNVEESIGHSLAGFFGGGVERVFGRVARACAFAEIVGAYGCTPLPAHGGVVAK